MVEVCRLEDLTEGDPRIEHLAGREIAVVLWKGEVYALRNVCPHQTQSFLAGHVHDRVVGGDTVGEVVLGEDDPILSCPVHGWEFQLHTGRCTSDPRLRVRTYGVEVRDGMVCVEEASS